MERARQRRARGRREAQAAGRGERRGNGKLPGREIQEVRLPGRGPVGEIGGFRVRERGMNTAGEERETIRFSVMSCVTGFSVLSLRQELCARDLRLCVFVLCLAVP